MILVFLTRNFKGAIDDTFCDFFSKNKRVSRFLFLLKTRLVAGSFYLHLQIICLPAGRQIFCKFTNMQIGLMSPETSAEISLNWQNLAKHTNFRVNMNFKK